MNSKFPAEFDRAQLVDINDIKIDTSLTCEERIKSYVKQIGNPYIYKDGDIVVKVSFADTPVSLQERLKSYACNQEFGNFGC